jgi:UDP-glucose 4-epimerase
MAEVEGVLDHIRDRRVLVTGGTGFIGSRLVKALRKVCDVTVLSSSRLVEGVETVNVDVREETSVIRSLEGRSFDVVFHLAGKIETATSSNAEDFIQTNAEGTRVLLEACRRIGIGRFVYGSSMSVFGPALYLPVDEKHPKLPRSVYGMSKLLGEIYCSEYGRTYGLGTVVLRYSHVYGPGQMTARVCAVFIRNALNEEPLKVYETAGSKYDFAYVDDIVNASILAAYHDNAVGQDFNIGSGEQWTIAGLSEVVRDLFPNARILHVPRGRQADASFVLDISKASQMLGYVPNYTLRRGLLEQIEYMRRETQKGR